MNKDYEYIVMVSGHWGRGQFLYEAAENCLNQCKTENHGLNRAMGQVKAWLGKKPISVDSYGRISSKELTALPDEEVHDTWGEVIRDEVSTAICFLSEAMGQFGVSKYTRDRADSVFTFMEEEIPEAIYKEFPECAYDGPCTRPPKERLEIPDYIKEAGEGTLKKWYMNARATQSCGGHRKGERNDHLVAMYTQELEDRGLEIPEGEGQFNGEGSS